MCGSLRSWPRACNASKPRTSTPASARGTSRCVRQPLRTHAACVCAVSLPGLSPAYRCPLRGAGPSSCEPQACSQTAPLGPTTCRQAGQGRRRCVHLLQRVLSRPARLASLQVLQGRTMRIAPLTARPTPLLLVMRAAAHGSPLCRERCTRWPHCPCCLYSCSLCMPVNPQLS